VIVAVAGGKGGVGKSTVAYNLGAALSAVVVDADLGMADLPTDRGPDLHDVLAGRATPVEAVREDGPVDLLPCGRSLVGARAADPTALCRTLSAVADAYSDVVVDCPAGLSADAGLPLLAADGCVLVTEPATVALPDVLRTRALATQLDAGLIVAVCNRVRDGLAPGARRRLRDVLGVPVETVAEQDAVGRATAAGRPVRAVAPDAPAVESFAAIARRIERAGLSR